VETLHPEGGESPFLVKDDASIAAVMSLNENDDDPGFASCPMDGCGEVILLTELDSHIEMHGAEEQDVDQEFEMTSRESEIQDAVQATFDTRLSRQLRNLSGRGSSTDTASLDRQASAKAAWKGLLKMPDAGAKPAPPPVSAKKGSRRRLGVSISLYSCSF
jgi:hypothetical protein